jgi:hypothetical protein
MPQGLPKKIEVCLLLPDLALQLGDPSPRRCPLIEDRAPQWRALQPALARSTGTPQGLQPTPPNLLLPLVQPLPIEPKRAGNRCHRLPFGDALYCPSFDLG